MTPEEIGKLMSSLSNNWLAFKGKSKNNIKQMAHDLKVPVSTLSCYFAGDRKWSFAVFMRCASYFGAMKIDLEKCLVQIKFPVTEANKKILKKFEAKK